MFGGQPELKVLAPIAGRTIPVTEVGDPTFSEEMLGKGIGILPTGNHVVAPVDGTIILMFDTGHAVSIISDDGIEILVHVGLDTIQLKGTHYTMRVKTGDTVKKGDVLMEFDREGIVAAGYNTVTPVVVCNPDDFEKIEMVTSAEVAELDPIIKLKKKP